jgi:hypothetical protein
MTNTDNHKILIFDSSTLISITINGLLEELRELRQGFNGRFIITNEVKSEIIDRPLKIKRFELEALKIDNLIKERILEMPRSLNLASDAEISSLTLRILQESNSLFESRGKPVHLIDTGEASCLALHLLLLEKRIESAIAIDERTTRMLVEKPENLRRFMEERLHMPLKQRKPYTDYTNLRIIRSSEIMYIAYKKGLLRLKGPKVLDAVLYGLKYKGCSIPDDEIEELKRI